MEITWDGAHLHDMSFNESDFVKNLRETHCKDCRNKNSPRKCRADILNEQMDNISEAINNEISKELLEKYGKETEK